MYMSKLLGKGGFGCVFYPGINCKGKILQDDTLATKVQILNFNSDNEMKIGTIIRKQGWHDLFFLPVISSCNINIRKSESKDLAECEILKDRKQKYVAMDIKYLENTSLPDIFKNNMPKDIILTFIESYKYLLMALEKLSSVNVVHCDLKLDNIMFLKNTLDPRIIDFGISIPIDELNKINMKKYFYIYSPDYYVWCIDINIINYLLHETTGVLTNEDAESISYLYVASTRPIQMYSQEYIQQFLDECIIQTKKYVGRPRDEVINELIGYSNTWDNYSLSIIYLGVISNLFKKTQNKSKFILNMTNILLENISPDPTKRLSVTETMSRYSDLYYIEIDINNYLELSTHIEETKQYTATLIELDNAHLKKISPIKKIT